MILHFSSFLFVSLTYWESAAYEKSWDGGLGDMRNPHELAFWVILHSSSCFLVCITYWESVPYKKSQDGDFGDLSNPIRHFLHFFFLLVGKPYVLVISTSREITGWGIWGL